MQDLELVEVHSDGEHLVLADSQGGQYLLAINDQLRAALRRDIAWMNRLKVDQDGGLRPREIQARIRAGMSAEELADASGTALEHIRRYEGPVLAEREHVATTARRTALTRSAGGDTLLETVVAERLAARGVDGEVVWDSWREDGGSWLVQLGFQAGGRPRVAQWRFDQGAATLDPIDDEARWLSGQPKHGPVVAAVTGTRELVYDIEADGGVREGARGTIREINGAATLAEDPQNRTLDLLDALRGRRGRRQPVDDREQTDLVDDLLDDRMHDDVDNGFDAELDEDLPPPAHPAASRPEEAVDAALISLPASAHGPRPAPRTPSKDTRSAAKPPTKSGKSKRPSVPSWDDIVFGAKED